MARCVLRGTRSRCSAAARAARHSISAGGLEDPARDSLRHDNDVRQDRRAYCRRTRRTDVGAGRRRCGRPQPDLHPHSLSPRHRCRWQPHGLCRRARQEGSAAAAGGRTIAFLCATARRTTAICPYCFSASLCSRDAFACWAIASQTQPPVGMVTPRLRALCAS